MMAATASVRGGGGGGIGSGGVRGPLDETSSASSSSDDILLPAHHEPVEQSPHQSRESRSQSVSSNNNSTSQRPIKRKPLSSTASALVAARYSTPQQIEQGPQQQRQSQPLILDLPRPETRFSRSYSLESPTVYDLPQTVVAVPEASSTHLSGQTDKSSSSNTNPEPSTAEASSSRNISASNPAALQTTPPDVPSHRAAPGPDLVPLSDSADSRPSPIAEEFAYDSASIYSHTSNDNTPAPPMFAPKPTPPHLQLGNLDTGVRDTPASSHTIPQEGKIQLDKSLPKSPLSTKFGNYFGWASSPSAANTEFSPIPSPVSQRPTLGANDTPTSSSTPITIPDLKANAPSNALGYCEDFLQTPPTITPAPPPVQIEEMEEELKAISAELAGSIRREMDLEDLVDRLQAEVNNQNVPGRRTSDYYSDSGVSSAKFSDYDQSREEVEKIQRRSEQEKAQIRLELTTKLQDERLKRAGLDKQIKELSQKASQMDLQRMNSFGANGRVKELESKCEELTRKLSEERVAKGNFEDLLAALKGELQSAANERDNLRDEVVPQLRARVEGLEVQAAEQSKMAYETTKMQQELQSLKDENSSLRQSGSGSGADAAVFRLQKPPAALARSGTVKQVESKEALAERLKDVEAQRDALHNALKSLLERQEFQNRENEKKIKALEIERNRLLAESPQKAGFEKDIANLRTEIGVLRRRAEEALQQKWRVEKGLAGLKMDLDRADEEIASLRSLLQQKDILIPSTIARSSVNRTTLESAMAVTSESLEGAYKDLQAAYRESLERIKKLELGIGGAPGSSDEKTQLALTRLEQSLAAAVSERDAARQEASDYKTRLDGLAAGEAQHLASERALADELQESARRVEELAAQVNQQLRANTELRQRVADAVARGEADRKAGGERVTGLQARLRTLEEQLAAAQATSEERLAQHEEQVAKLKEAHSHQLRRVSSSPAAGGLRSPSPGLLSPGLLSPPGRNGFLSPQPSPGLHSRRSSSRLSDAPRSAEEDVQMAKLRARVAELEKALAEADGEMQDVVARMSAAQIEVMNLQEEREAARRETRKLQKVLEEERIAVFEGRFKTLSS